MESSYVLDHLAAIVESSGDAIVGKTLDGTITSWNRGATELYGFSAEEMLGKSIEAIIPDDRPGELPNILKRLARGETIHHFETVRLCKDGRNVPVSVTVSPIRAGDGQVVGASSIARDIAERKRMETRLQASEARFRAVFTTAVEGIITIDEAGVVESMNPAAERMFGYEPAEVLGQNVALLMPSPFRERHDGYLQNYLQTGQAKIIGIGREVEGRRKDGSRFPMDLSVGEVRLDQRRIFTGLLRDISERKRSEALIRRERDFAQRILDTAHSIILVLDRQGRIVSYNRFMEQLTDYPLRETQGKDWFETFIPAAERVRIHNLFRQAMVGSIVEGSINPICTKAGALRTISWWAHPLTGDNDEIDQLLCVGHDVSELISAQQRAVQNERLAAIGQMSTAVAHETRNALGRIKMSAELLRLRSTEVSHTEIDTIERATNDVVRVMEEVRTFAAPIILEREEVDIAAIWRRAWRHLQASRQSRDAELVEQIETDRPLYIDSLRMEQVFRNLFENALAACRDPVRIEVQCRDIMTDEDGSHLRIVVQDNGPGISGEQRARLFDAFYTTKQKGTGLGLAICKRFVEAHHGSIVASNRSGGAEFIIDLPRRNSPPSM